MAIEINTFLPTGPTVLVAATTVSASQTIGFSTAINAGSVRVYNDGPNLAFVTFGKTTATASVTSIPVPVGAVEVLGKVAFDTFAAVTLTGTANVYFTPGIGN